MTRKSTKSAEQAAAAETQASNETNIVNPDEQNFNRSESAPASKAGANVKKVIFKLHSGAVREFSQETHGDDFAAIADGFHSTNEKSDENRKLRRDHVVSRTEE